MCSHLLLVYCWVAVLAVMPDGSLLHAVKWVVHTVKHLTAVVLAFSEDLPLDLTWMCEWI
jgi:hypothetical protein